MSYGKFLFLYLVARNIGDTMTTKVFEAFKNTDFSELQCIYGNLGWRRARRQTPAKFRQTVNRKF